MVSLVFRKGAGVYTDFGSGQSLAKTAFLSCFNQFLPENAFGWSRVSHCYTENRSEFRIDRDCWKVFVFSQPSTVSGLTPSISAISFCRKPRSSLLALKLSPRVFNSLGYPSGFRNSLNFLDCNMATQVCS